jgi:hypothetical protein
MYKKAIIIILLLVIVWLVMTVPEGFSNRTVGAVDRSSMFGSNEYIDPAFNVRSDETIVKSGYFGVDSNYPKVFDPRSPNPAPGLSDVNIPWRDQNSLSDDLVTDVKPLKTVPRAALNEDPKGLNRVQNRGMIVSNLAKGMRDAISMPFSWFGRGKKKEVTKEGVIRGPYGAALYRPSLAQKKSIAKLSII